MTTTPLPPPPTFNGPVDAPKSRAVAVDVPPGYRLVRVETLEMIAAEMARLKQFERLPSFLTADHLRRA
jgi:hypothetical protein